MSHPARLDVPEPVLAIARRLEDAGFETWCVGGAVRDTLLGEPNADFDLATAATPDDIIGLFRRTVPVGVEHGTVAVLDPDGGLHEVTTFRRDVETDGRHAVVRFGVSLDDDLARRDFTINAIAYHPTRYEWRDPFDGRSDLTRGVIRAVGDPESRVREDYLRILRALRFSARFGAGIEPATWAAMVANVDGLHHLSAERVRDEWFKGLTSARSRAVLVAAWRAVGALAIWLPELRIDGDIDRLPVDPVLITAFLSSDPAATLTRLKASRAEVDRGRAIGVLRALPLPPPDDAGRVRRFLSTLGPRADDVLAIAGDPALDEAARRVRASGAPLTLADLAVTGHDLVARGLSGPEVGAALRRLLDEVLDDPARNEREYLLTRV